MATLSLSAIAAHMQDLDICMMTTQGKTSSLNSRPMSNNRDVTYKGDSYFFTMEKTRKVKDLEANARVCLNFEGKGGLFISVAGKGKLIRSKQAFAEHWDKSLDQWFPDGVDTKGLVLLHVKGNKIQYWQKEEQGEIKLAKKA